MALVDSPRLLPQDRTEWARRAMFDRRLAAGLRDKPDAAVRCVEEWAAGFDGPVTVAVSWGKDSVVVADLALRSAVADRVVLRWVRQRWFENPDCVPVRDAFLAAHPGVRYEERVVTSPVPRRWDMTENDNTRYRQPSPRRGGAWPERRVTGIRADESDSRRLSANVHGESTETTCRPIIRWSTTDVFAYLAARDLPVHPAYAMTTMGGQDRDRIRVHSLGGTPGLHSRGPWEDAYYGDVIRADRAAVAVLRCLPASKRGQVHTSMLRARVMEVVEGLSPVDVSTAVHRLEDDGVVARLCRQGHEYWWRWPDKSVPIPGVHVAGDLAGR